MQVIAEVDEAAAALELLIDLALGGASVQIRRNGEPIAELLPAATPVPRLSQDRVDEILQELRAIGASSKPGPESISDLIGEGRRY